MIPTQEFPYEFCAIVQKTYFEEHVCTAASVGLKLRKKNTNFVSAAKQPPEVLCKNSALKNFTKFIGKHLQQD